MNKLSEIIKVSDIHYSKIVLAKKHICHLFPMTMQSVKNLQENDMLWLELLVNRFGKLQDLLGAKIINMFLEEQAEDVDNMTMLDKINRCERLGIIKDAELWKVMRNTRNHVAHEYPDEPEITAKYLNQLFDLIPDLLNILDNIKKKRQSKLG